MMTITSNVALESIHSLNTKELSSSQDAIECKYHCSECRHDRYVTMELWPEGPMVRAGKYTSSTKTIKASDADHLTLGYLKGIYEESRSMKYDILDGKKSSKVFCEKIWNKVFEQ
mmetsp:Transcript_7044/g.7980  ORF Transcript_7044/g.7980 Transcript_7044/m.7980 type:complete len:115 (-) Transcript_7044:78-422(-)